MSVSVSGSLKRQSAVTPPPICIQMSSLSFLSLFANRNVGGLHMNMSMDAECFAAFWICCAKLLNSQEWKTQLGYRYWCAKKKPKSALANFEWQGQWGLVQDKSKSEHFRVESDSRQESRVQADSRPSQDTKNQNSVHSTSPQQVASSIYSHLKSRPQLRLNIITSKSI